MKILSSLSEIPLVLFNEFSISEQPADSGRFHHTGASSVVHINRSKVAGPNGPHTLAFEDYICDYGRWHRKTLMVFNFPIAAAEAFADGGKNLSPKLTIGFRVDDPPHHSTRCRFESGKGFWVDEHITAKYGAFNDDVSVTSNHGDWEFAFLLQIQQRCHKLVRQVVSRGHWQCEWNPKGDYSKEPVLCWASTEVKSSKVTPSNFFIY